MTQHRYDPFTQSLHWMTAFAVIAAYAIGIGREALPKGDLRSFLLGLHMSIGILVLGLTMVRIGWRNFVPAPVPLPSTKRVALAAKLVHLGLYAAMLAIPVLGLLAAWAKGRDVGFFGLLAFPSPIGQNKVLAKSLEGAHEVAAHAMMLLAGLHAAAAIAHQTILKDGTLARMLPAGRPAETAF